MNSQSIIKCFQAYFEPFVEYVLGKAYTLPFSNQCSNGYMINNNHNLSVRSIFHLTVTQHIVLSYQYTVRCRYNAVSFLTNIHKNTPHSSPVMAKYGVSFVDPASDWYSASVSVIIYVISYNTGPCYNGNQLHLNRIFAYTWSTVP